MRHPAVLECAVVSTPDPYWGSGPSRNVAPRPGMDVDGDDVIAFCREHLAHFKDPAAVHVGELPKTSTGKVQKYLLSTSGPGGRRASTDRGSVRGGRCRVAAQARGRGGRQRERAPGVDSVPRGSTPGRLCTPQPGPCSSRAPRAASAGRRPTPSRRPAGASSPGATRPRGRRRGRRVSRRPSRRDRPRERARRGGCGGGGRRRRARLRGEQRRLGRSSGRSRTSTSTSPGVSSRPTSSGRSR